MREESRFPSTNPLSEEPPQRKSSSLRLITYLDDFAHRRYIVRPWHE